METHSRAKVKHFLHRATARDVHDTCARRRDAHRVWGARHRDDARNTRAASISRAKCAMNTTRSGKDACARASRTRDARLRRRWMQTPEKNRVASRFHARTTA
jgi:hypothetical protein